MFIANLFARLRRGGDASGTTPGSADPVPASGTAQRAGVKVASVEELLAAHKDVIARIKLCYGCDNATFETDLLQPIRAYAAYVNALPATRASHYSQSGGLLRLGLETAFYALQATDSQIFAGRETISKRRILEPRWRRATFIAGLCGELYRCLGQLKVYDGPNHAWQAYLLPLSTWLRERRCTHLTVQWLPGAERRALGLFALPFIVPPATMEDLAHGNDVIVPNMLASISGLATYHDHNVMDRLVRHAAALVLQRERGAPGGNAAEGEVPVHLARHVIEAMRELVQSDHSWLPNVARSRLWYGDDGLYLVWPNGAADIIRLLADEQLPGAPDNALAVLDILAAGGIAPPSSSGGYIVSIQPPGAREAISAVPLAPPGLLLADLVPTPEPLHRCLKVHGPCAEQPPACPPEDKGDPWCDAVEEPPVAPPVPGRPERKKAARTAERQEAMPAQLSLPAMPAPDGSVEEGTAAPVPRGVWRAGRGGQLLPIHDAATNLPRHAELRPPMRLNRSVARALAAIVGSLHGERPACHVVAGSLFVPLTSFARQGVDARQAWRALADAGMIEPDESGEGVQSAVIDGAKVPGVRLAPQFVTGLAVDSVGAKESTHADA
ncbi:MobH family relaxase [Pseudoduganella namucuonensis]|uniref:Conjugal transfer pilus assembly protein TraI n=1 Tax=Pseudoduganella namucuonensis TaxID=1035707 RepID=A0A1I7HKK0_9BURK|nr:MobH family relaxase [Pseudoduganella namucuonensis]SFU61233.1 conjugal transfer pilus assembly protein TraI [Pseudoduganella namucuonensis]